MSPRAFTTIPQDLVARLNLIKMNNCNINIELFSFKINQILICTKIFSGKDHSKYLILNFSMNKLYSNFININSISNFKAFFHLELSSSVTDDRIEIIELY